MQTFKVSGNGAQVSVESDNWLFAIALSLPQLGLDPAALDQLVCSRTPDGDVAVVDGTNRVRIGVASADASTPLDIPDSALHGAPPPEADSSEHCPPPPAAADEVAVSDEQGPEVQAHELAPPVVTTEERLAKANALAEELRSTEDADGACDAALRIVTHLVEAEAGAVLRRLYQTRSLSFVAAVGASAHQVLGTTLGGTTGIAGFAFTSGLGVIVQDVDTDGRFSSAVDNASGYRTRSILAMPIRIPDGPIFGCLELLNGPNGFTSDDLAVVRVVALALGRRLRAAAE